MVKSFIATLLAAAFSATTALAQGPGPVPPGAVPPPVNVSTLTNHGVVVGQGVSPVNGAVAGTLGQCFMSNGSSADPTMQTCPSGTAGAVTLVGSLISANFNSGGTGTTGDQAITLTGPPGKWFISSIVIANCSTSLTTAKGTFYYSTGKNALIFPSGLSTTVYTGITSSTSIATIAQTTTSSITVAQQASLFTTAGQTVYLSLTTPQGSTATCDVYVYGTGL